MNGYHIHIQGRVQGVGFRPFVYRVASAAKLRGWIKNTLDGVHIEVFSKSPIDIDAFVDKLAANAPPQAKMEHIDYRAIMSEGIARGFEIAHTGESGPVSMALTPDFAMCEDCRRELSDPHNRRYGYPFITCINCGPRFSIVRKLPYDRQHTTMDAYTMCGDCGSEYRDPDDRRFHAQTNSCGECPVTLTLYHADGSRTGVPGASILSFVADRITEGSIVAIKGIGGYLLVADAGSPGALEQLRVRKNRPAKPFALMYSDVAAVAEDVVVTEEMIEAWQSAESPIVLCELKEDGGRHLQLDLVAPGLQKLGIMLPYAPLFALLLEKLRRPVVATSGNISGSPIIYEDDKAFRYFGHIADYILVNDREIVVPQDDSLVQFSRNNRRRILLRRSRGMAPDISIQGNGYAMDGPVFSAGAMLKSAFGLYHEGRFYVSQYLGNTGELESLESYEAVARHMFSVLDFKPALVVTDAHPDYPATRFGQRVAAEYRAEITQVQHHRAHAYAVMGENDLLNTSDILNIVWDGTGWGEDGQIWGGEFFLYTDRQMQRGGHWSYFPHIAGDKMSREPRISALSLVSHMDPVPSEVLQKFSAVEKTNYLKIARGQKLKTSSVGRLFDGVASILDLADLNRYEGEAAMKLEAAGSRFGYGHEGYDAYYDIPVSEDGVVHTKALIRSVLEDRQRGKEVPEIAFKFHLSLVHLIGAYAERMEVGRLAFSGGVFQNALLADLLEDHLSEDYSLYFHKELSPNDECVPYGQMVACYAERRSRRRSSSRVAVESLNQ